MRGGAVAAVLVGAALVLSGCQYLLGPIVGGPIYPLDPGFGSFDPGEFGSFDPNDPAFSMPPPEATFTKGSADVTIDGDGHAPRSACRARRDVQGDRAPTSPGPDGDGNYVHYLRHRATRSVVDGRSRCHLAIDRIADWRKHLGTRSIRSACTIKVPT